MGDVALFCLFQGDPFEQSFRVTMSREDYVSDLRKLIIAECANMLQGVDAHRLSLYCISIADNNELARLDLRDTPPLHPRTTIGTLFPDGPGENEYIFIINGMVLRCGLICVLLCSCRWPLCTSFKGDNSAKSKAVTFFRGPHTGKLRLL